jgi:glycosyltransferase involved in cell wall biosynthesis
MPTLNARRFLKERMDSILSQTVTDWELIVCDSFSEDGTWEYLQQYREDPRIRLFQVPKEGLYAGWNECLKRVRGEFVHIATADDTGGSNLLETLSKGLQDSPDLYVSACECMVIDAVGNEIIRPPTVYDAIIKSRISKDGLITTGKQELALLALCGGTWGSFSRLMFRSDLFNLAGHFPVDVGVCGDWAWILRACEHSGVVHLPGRLATWRVHGEQASAAWGMQGYRDYHEIFTRFLDGDRARHKTIWDMDEKIRQILMDLAWRRYEEGSGWFLYQLYKSPAKFFNKAKLIWKLDPSLFARRIRSGCRVPESLDNGLRSVAELGHGWSI